MITSPFLEQLASLVEWLKTMVECGMPDFSTFLETRISIRSESIQHISNSWPISGCAGKPTVGSSIRRARLGCLLQRRLLTKLSMRLIQPTGATLPPRSTGIETIGNSDCLSRRFKDAD